MNADFKSYFARNSVQNIDKAYSNVSSTMCTSFCYMFTSWNTVYKFFSYQQCIQVNMWKLNKHICIHASWKKNVFHDVLTNLKVIYLCHKKQPYTYVCYAYSIIFLIRHVMYQSITLYLCMFSILSACFNSWSLIPFRQCLFIVFVCTRKDGKPQYQFYFCVFNYLFERFFSDIA